MRCTQIFALIDDFIAWGGGLPPVDQHEIDQYCEWSLDKDLPEDEARQVLASWMRGKDDYLKSIGFPNRA